MVPLVLGTLFLGSCMDDELNRPGGKISDGDLQGDNYILGAFFPQMTDMVVPAQENNYQMDENLVGDIYGRYMMFTNDGWSAAKNPPLYIVRKVGILLRSKMLCLSFIRLGMK